MSYNVASNYFYYTANQFSSSDNYRFEIDGVSYGDNIADGTVEPNGANILVNTSGTKLFKLYFNFNGTGNYTIN